MTSVSVGAGLPGGLMFEARRVLSVAVGFVLVLALVAGGALWWHSRVATPPRVAAVKEPNLPPKGLTEDGMERPERPAPVGPIELAPDVAKTKGEQMRSCARVIAFVDRCVAGSIPLNGNAWSRIGGYSMPLPDIPKPPKDFSLEPNPAVCAVAAEWRTYCTANVYPR